LVLLLIYNKCISVQFTILTYTVYFLLGSQPEILGSVIYSILLDLHGKVDRFCRQISP